MIRPEEVLRPNEDDEATIKRIEAAIDAEIKRQGRYKGSSINIDYDLFGKDHVIRQELLARYRKAGWNIRHESDQREQTSYYVFG
jgi:hypothetical protein